MTDRETISNIIMDHFGAFGVRESQAWMVAKEIIESTTMETLRDRFAGQALAGALANSDISFQNLQTAESARDQLAKMMYSLSDAMLKERQNTTDEPGNGGSRE